MRTLFRRFFLYFVFVIVSGCGGGSTPAVPLAAPQASSSGAAAVSGQPSGSKVTSPLPGAATTVPLPVAAAPGSSIDWPTFGFNAERSGENASETVLTPATVVGLHLLWSYKIGDATDKYVTTQPVIASNVLIAGTKVDVAYVGSQHGLFAAVDAARGTPIWTKQLGVQTTACGDMPDKIWGITSTAAIDRALNRVYVVDGKGMLYALDLGTGAVSAGWPAGGVQVVVDPTLDHVWSAIALNPARSRAYVTSASYCDFGRWHGGVQAIDTGAGSIARSFYMATGTSMPPSGQTNLYGGGIWGWGGIAIDPITANLYGVTGNVGPTEESVPNSESFMEWDPMLDAPPIADMMPNDPYKLGDNDFGSSVALYDDNGGECAAAGRKSGIFYTFDRTNIAKGPATLIIMGHGFATPVHSSRTHLLYFQVADDNAAFQHGLYAFQTGPGCTLNQQPVWHQSTQAFNTAGFHSPPTVAGGVVYEGINAHVAAYDATSGAALWESGTTVAGRMVVAPTVVNGRVYTVDWSGHLNAFGL